MQTYMSMRGGSVAAANNTVMVDGMVINGLRTNGDGQTYTNDANFQEMTYQTAGMSAERSGGGVAMNLVPKEGGNSLQRIRQRAVSSRPASGQQLLATGSRRGACRRTRTATRPSTASSASRKCHVSQGGPIRRTSCGSSPRRATFSPSTRCRIRSSTTAARASTTTTSAIRWCG